MKSAYARWLNARALGLAVIPLLLLLATLLITQSVGKPGVDPDFIYLLNGLEILTIYPPSYFDHPGTPLELLSALLIAVTWLVSLPFQGARGLVTSVLTHPDFYLRAINPVLVLLAAGAMVYAGHRIRAATGSLAAALAAQATVFTSFSVLTWIYRVTPEPLLLGSGLVVIGLLAPFVFQPERITNAARQALLLGLAIGFCIATKVTAIPLMLTLLLLRENAWRKKAVLGVVAGGFICTIPILHHYPAMLGWFFRLGSNSGGYGTGSRGLPAAAVLADNLLTLVHTVPEIFLALLVYGVLLLLRASRQRRLLLVSILVLGLQILMTVKQPAARYLLPCIAVMALANAGIAWELCSLRDLRAWKAALALLLAGCIAYNILAVRSWTLQMGGINRENDRFIGHAYSSGCAVVPFYPVQVRQFSLHFGNYYTHGHFTEALQRLYPSAVTYDAFRGTFLRGFSEQVLPSGELEAKLGAPRCIYLLGAPLERFGEPKIPPRSVSLVGKTPYGLADGLVLYRLNPGALESR